MTGWLITATGQVTAASPTLQEEGAGNFEALYEALGCSMVQLVMIEHGEMWMDEEGTWKPDAALNEKASSLFGQSVVGTVYVRLEDGYKLVGTE